MNPEEIIKRILYRDALILVLDKPSGIAVHTANGGLHNLERYFPALQFGLPNPPTLGHRLDRGTSGCLILARHKEAARRLGVLFAENRIKKSYWAVVSGRFSEDEGRIDLPLSKQSSSRKHWWMKVDQENGVSAITDYRVLGRGDGLTWLELTPQTGRTHQLRVHCAALGHPILGDYIYGPDQEGIPKDGLHLHARSLEIPLYPKKAPIPVAAMPPLQMQEALAACGYASEA
ncbi:MAG: RNA pseudouridine synthase [Alphaproteobacteria bacterium]|jgi:RluA family pseudouridine synthase|nr:RNA pseudouridine synthase [Alphaproteobacteria bacterium]